MQRSLFRLHQSVFKNSRGMVTLVSGDMCLNTSKYNQITIQLTTMRSKIYAYIIHTTTIDYLHFRKPADRQAKRQMKPNKSQQINTQQVERSRSQATSTSFLKFILQHHLVYRHPRQHKALKMPRMERLKRLVRPSLTRLWLWTFLQMEIEFDVEIPPKGVQNSYESGGYI